MHLHYCIAKCLEIQVLKFATSFCFLLQWHIGIPFPNTTLSHSFIMAKLETAKNIHLRLWFILTFDTEKVVPFELMAMFMS